MDIKDFKNVLFEKAKNYGINEFELFYQRDKSFSVGIYKGKIEKFKNNSSGGVSFRAIINGKAGYAYSENINEESVDFIIKSSIENAKIINSDEKEFIYKGDNKYPNVNIYNDKLNSYDTDFKVDLAKKLEKTALEYDKRIVSVESCSVGNSEVETYIANSNGLELSEKSNYAISYISVTAEENGVKKTGGQFWQGKDFGPVNYVEIAEIACEKALSMLKGDMMSKGEMNAIFKNEAFADVITTFLGSFFAENVQKGFSLFTREKINQKVASNCLTIQDLPLLSDGFASCSFDSEGVASFDKTVIENGVLKTLLYNLKSADKDGVKSTGNGFKAGFKGTIATSATNFVIKKGNLNFEQLVQTMDKGVIITGLAGLHSGADAISGNFSLAAEGFFVESGKIVKPIEQITVSGNFYELIKNIENIGNDVYFDMVSQRGAVICPSVLVKEINIAS